MTHFFKISSVVLALGLSVSAVHAKELKGAALVNALNGKAFNCKLSDSTMDWDFAASDPNGSLFPYTVTLNGKTYKSAYKLLRNGTMRHDQTRKRRKIVQNKDGSLTVTGNGVPTSTCVLR